MSPFGTTIGHKSYSFESLKVLLAKASPARSGDALAGVAAEDDEERVAAQFVLADVPLARLVDEPLIPYDDDEVTRLIVDSHDQAAFAPVSDMTVGQFRDWLLCYETTGEVLSALAPGLTPEMVAAVSKLMRNQDLILVASKCRVVTRFRNTIGLPGRLSIRLQPNHPTDDLVGIGASILDGLLYGCGDAVIGINPATDSVETVVRLLRMLAELIETYRIPTQSCVLAHVTTQLAAIKQGAPVDLVFQSIAGTEAANASFGVNLKLLDEAQDAAHSLSRGTLGNNVMYFETGQGSCLSANAHHGVDQQTLEARAYAVARRFEPLLGEHGGGFHRARILVRRQADHSRRAGRSFLRQAVGRADGLRRVLHEPRRGRSGRYGQPAHAAGRGGLQLFHGRAGGRRYHAELPIHVVPRQPLLCGSSWGFDLRRNSRPGSMRCGLPATVRSYYR